MEGVRREEAGEMSRGAGFGFLVSMGSYGHGRVVAVNGTLS
jgi:hypothetical protein